MAWPPSSATAPALVPASRPAVMSPCRWQQETRGAQNAGQADQLRALGQPGRPSQRVSSGRQPAPAGQRPGQRVGDVAPLGLGAAGEEVPARRTRLPPAASPGSGPAPARPAAHGRAPGRPRRPSAAKRRCRGRCAGRSGSVPAPAPRHTSATARSRRDPGWAGRPLTPGSRRSPAGLLLRLGAPAGQRRVGGVQVRHHAAGR